MMHSMSLSRRGFLTACSASALGTLALSGLSGAAFANPGVTPTAEQPILVVVFLRGGMDALNFLGPVDDKDYVSARPKGLRVVGGGEDAGLALGNALAGSDFRLHHEAQALKELYDGKQLAIIPAAGLVNGTRSHFDAQSLMERGLAAEAGVREGSGWLARLLASRGAKEGFDGVSISASMPESFHGAWAATALENPRDFGLWTGGDDAARIRSFLRHSAPGGGMMQQATRRALGTLDHFDLRFARDGNGKRGEYKAANGAKYGDNDYAQPLERLAQLIKLDLGVQIAMVDFGGWDTHEHQDYRFAEMTRNLSGALGAFWNDMSAYHGRLRVVVMSEFGRRLKSNKSDGTDHGHGGLMMAMGAGVGGGKMWGKWPGLATEQLDSEADLAVTTDYRAVLSEVIGGEAAKVVFPGFVGERVGVVG